MSEDFSGVSAQLELKDRMGYSEHLLSQLRAFEKVVVNPNKRLEMQRIMYSMLKGIPSSWRDETFQEDLKNIRKEVTIDIRPTFGVKKLSVEYCKRNKIPMIRKKFEIDYFALKEAIINLFDRLQLLIRREKIEYSTGKNLDVKTIEELYIDEDENGDE